MNGHKNDVNNTKEIPSEFLVLCRLNDSKNIALLYTMNPVVIVLGVIAIVLIYVLYQYFTKTATILSRALNLNNANPAILATSLKNPANYSCSYGVWVYVNSWPTAASRQKQILFNRDANATTISNGTDIALYLDPVSPTLYAQIKSNTIMITNNF